jgi:UDP-4-amino-4,6-dideoxy-N-acetyl-beta-L-altrosamine transaminase
VNAQADFLPYARQDVSLEDREAVVAALRSDWLTGGPAVEDFEAVLADAVDASHAIACSSGTAALHLSLAGLGIGEGDTCIVPAITFAATANAARYLGARVVFADVDPATGLLTEETVGEAVSRAGGIVSAILPVHIAGQCADVTTIREAYPDIALIEDAAHAIGSTERGQKVGSASHSDAVCFSFHPVKTITCGEGGAITLRNTKIADRIRSLRSHGIVRNRNPQGGAVYRWHYSQEAMGWNYRLTDIQAALGRSQLSRLDIFVARRRSLVARYDSLLCPLAPAIRPLGRRANCDPCWHLYVARIDFDACGTSRDAVMNELSNRGIGTQVHYIPVYHHPAHGCGDSFSLPGAEAYYESCLSLPLFPAMRDDDPDRVVDALRSVLGL